MKAVYKSLTTIPRKTNSAIKTAVHSCPSTADTPLPVVGVLGCQGGVILDLSVCAGVVVVAVTVGVLVGITAGVTVVVVSDAISVPGIIRTVGQLKQTEIT